MQNHVDMHVHSTYSDGDYSPSEVVRLSGGTGLSGVVLTDHGTTNGTDEAIAEAHRLGLLTCEGIEINGTFEGTGVHIVGYATHFDRNVLREGLRETLQGDSDYNTAIARKLRDLGVATIDTDAVVRRKGVVYKIDVMRELVRQTGMTFHDAKRLTSRGGAAHVPYPTHLISVVEAVRLIRRAGGIAVLAHPELFFQRTPHPQEKAKQLFWTMLDILIAEGIKGIEARSGRHTTEQVTFYEEIATKRNLLITGGSDFHGEHEPNQHLGEGTITTDEFHQLLVRFQNIQHNQQ